MRKGFTLVEVLVGVALALIVFLGVLGAFRLGLKVVGQSKARTTAVALATKQIEEIRNLSYSDAGTYACKPEFPNCDPGEENEIIPGYPFGKIKNASTTRENNIDYSIAVEMDYAIDEFDGLAAPDDQCPNDYKKVKVKVSWAGKFSGEVMLNTIISPKNSSQECAEAGGILKVRVFDAGGLAVAFPNIQVTNINTGLIKSAAPESGIYYFTLPPDSGAYKIEITKSGYSSERTFANGEEYNGKTIATPANPHATIIEGQLTETSFAIDKVSTLLVKSYAEGAGMSFVDSFFDASKIVESSNVEINNGEVKLTKYDSVHYNASGYIISQTIQPANLISWNDLSYTDNSPPNTLVRYQVLYLNEGNWVLVPDADLPGNSSGLQNPPIDLDRLDKEEYPQIRLLATLLSQGGQTKTPVIYDWTAKWFAGSSTTINSVAFTITGQKTVGLTSSHQPIYKYSAVKQTNGGSVSIGNLEWDVYSFSVDKSQTGLDLSRTDPLQPINLLPDSSQEANLYLTADNSLMVEVKNSATGNPIFSASARLYNVGLDYDQSLLTDESGQAFFLPLSVATYTLIVGAEGFQGNTSSVSVSGAVNKTINLVPQ
jgi:prepilin-type N-terminal cleavage/methylation domain-containing protein